MGAGVECVGVHQDDGEDEHERGGASVEDQEQLRAPCGDCLAHITATHTAEVRQASSDWVEGVD